MLVMLRDQRVELSPFSLLSPHQMWLEKFSSGGQNRDIIDKELFEEMINTFFSKCGILSRFSVICQQSTAG